MSLTLSAQHIDVPETNRVVQFPMKFNFAGLQAFPPTPSDKLSNLTWVIDEDHQLRIVPGIAGPNGDLPSVQFRTRDPLRWQIPVYGWNAPVGYIDEQATDEQLQFRKQQIDFAYHKSILYSEWLACQFLRDATGTLTPYPASHVITKAAGSRWDDLLSPNSDPIADLRLGAEYVEQDSGLPCNKVVMTRTHLRKLVSNQRVIGYAVSKLEWDENREITTDVLELLCGLPKGSIQITNALYERSPDGPNPTRQRRYFMGPDVWMGAVGEGLREGISDNTWGYGRYLALTEVAGGAEQFPRITTGNEGLIVVTYPELPTKRPLGGTVTQVVLARKNQVQNPSAGVIIKAALDATRPEYRGMLND